MRYKKTTTKIKTATASILQVEKNIKSLINFEQQQEQEQHLDKQPQKRKLKIFDYLNGKDVKKNRK